MTKYRIALVASVAAMGCASAFAMASKTDRLAETLSKYERTGEYESCLSLRSIRSMTALDDKHFLVRVGAGKYYLNETRRCGGASRAGNRIQYTIRGVSQLCKNEIITIVDNSSGMTVGSCGLNAFERLEEKPADTE